MVVFEKMLRAFVREELMRLSEAAATPAAAAASGFALMKPAEGQGSYVLYDAEKTVRALTGMARETWWKLAAVVESEKAVIGMIDVKSGRQCGGARIVLTSAAERGFGPLMYDIALADGPLAPMRDSVSSSAERVWRHYFEQRNDVAHHPLMGCKQHPKVRSWLNFVYEAKNPINVNSLVKAHDGVLAKLTVEFTRGDVEAVIRRASDGYFDSRYTEA